MFDFLYGDFLTRRPSIGILLFRLVTGAALMIHGFPKIQHAFTWMHGAPVPGILQAASAVAEFGGGLALILGILTPIAALLITINFLVAIFMVHVPHGDPWISQGGKSYEPALGYLIAAVSLFFTGPGQYSLDFLLLRTGKFFGRTPKAAAAS